MKVRLGELQLDTVITLLSQHNLKLVVAESKNDLTVNHINPDFTIEVGEDKDVTRDGSISRENS